MGLKKLSGHAHRTTEPITVTRTLPCVQSLVLRGVASVLGIPGPESQLCCPIDIIKMSNDTVPYSQLLAYVSPLGFMATDSLRRGEPN